MPPILVKKRTFFSCINKHRWTNARGSVCPQCGLPYFFGVEVVKGNRRLQTALRVLKDDTTLARTRKRK